MTKISREEFDSAIDDLKMYGSSTYSECTARHVIELAATIRKFAEQQERAAFAAGWIRALTIQPKETCSQAFQDYLNQKEGK